MNIADRLRVLREQKKLSQGDIQESTELLRAYISRLENGHTVPAPSTLEKIARAFKVPLWEMLYDGERLPESRPTVKGYSRRATNQKLKALFRLPKALASMTPRDRKILLAMSREMLRRRRVA